MPKIRGDIRYEPEEGDWIFYVHSTGFSYPLTSWSISVSHEREVQSEYDNSHNDEIISRQTQLSESDYFELENLFGKLKQLSPEILANVAQVDGLPTDTFYIDGLKIRGNFWDGDKIKQDLLSQVIKILLKAANIEES